MRKSIFEKKTQIEVEIKHPITEKTIDHKTFKRIISYNDAVIGKDARNHMKMEMLNTVIDAIGERWFRLKDETRSALEYLCFLAVERGFVYAGSKHVGERHDIDSSTVRKYVVELERKGVMKRKWRSSMKRNSRGQAVIFFTVHPYYTKYWENTFFYQDETHINKQDDNDETPTQSKPEPKIEDSTVPEPNLFKELKKGYKDWQSSEFTSSNVPNAFKELALCYFDSSKMIEGLWSRVKIFSWKNMFDKNAEVTLQVGIEALKQAVQKLKSGKLLKDLPAYFAGALKGKFNDRYQEALEEVAEEKEVATIESKRTYIREEMIPEWLYEEDEVAVEVVKEQLDESALQDQRLAFEEKLRLMKESVWGDFA